MTSITVTGLWDGNTFANGDVKAYLYIPAGSAVTAISGAGDAATTSGERRNVTVSGTGTVSGSGTGTISNVGLAFPSSSSSSSIQLGVRIWLQSTP